VTVAEEKQVQSSLIPLKKNNNKVGIHAEFAARNTLAGKEIVSWLIVAQKKKCEFCVHS
jgi:hypothetical protein